jgi:hypothetical protein
MPGKNSPGYQAAYARATRRFASMMRLRFPRVWFRVLDEELAKREPVDWKDIPDWMNELREEQKAGEVPLQP